MASLKAIKELLASEQSYCQALHKMMEIYYRPLRNAQYNAKPELSEQAIDIVFSNLEDLLVIADQLSLELEERLGAFNRDSCGSIAAPRVGDIMVRCAPLLKIYERYITTFERGSNCLIEAREKSKSLSEFIQKATSSEDGVLSLESYLIMPVQRILRYKLLLEDILKNTEPQSEDYEDLQKALALVSERALQCNEATRRRENMEALRRIQQSLAGADIITPERTLLMEGHLKRVISRTNETRDLMWYLFKDCLLCAEALNLTFSQKFQIKRKFDIGRRGDPKRINLKVGRHVEGGHLMEVIDCDTKSFKILASSKTYTVVATDEREKEQWLKALKEALASAEMNNLQRDRSEGPSAIQNDALKADGTSCTICEARFSTFHMKRCFCRKCGQCICLKCSIEMDKGGNGLEIRSWKGMQARIITVYSNEVLLWHRDLRREYEVAGKSMPKVTLCHQCMYGKEYFRKDELAYLRWVKANGLFGSDGYQNFRQQPGKQAIISQFRSATAGKSEGEVTVTQSPEQHVSFTGRPDELENESVHYSDTCQFKGSRERLVHETASSSKMVKQIWFSRRHVQTNIDKDMTPNSPPSNSSSAEEISGSDTDADEEVPSRARALYSFEAVEDCEIELRPGEIIELLSENDDDGWCYGRNSNGNRGYFPASHVEIIDADSLNIGAGSPDPRKPQSVTPRSPASEEGGSGQSAPETPPSDDWTVPERAAITLSLEEIEEDNRQRKVAVAQESYYGYVGSEEWAMQLGHAQRILKAQADWKEQIAIQPPVQRDSKRKPSFARQIAGMILGSGATVRPPVLNPEPLSIMHLGSPNKWSSPGDAPLPRAIARSADSELSSPNDNPGRRQSQGRVSQSTPFANVPRTDSYRSSPLGVEAAEESHPQLGNLSQTIGSNSNSELPIGASPKNEKAATSPAAASECLGKIYSISPFGPTFKTQTHATQHPSPNQPRQDLVVEPGQSQISESHSERSFQDSIAESSNPATPPLPEDEQEKSPDFIEELFSPTGNGLLFRTDLDALLKEAALTEEQQMFRMWAEGLRKLEMEERSRMQNLPEDDDVAETPPPVATRTSSLSPEIFSQNDTERSTDVRHSEATLQVSSATVSNNEADSQPVNWLAAVSMSGPNSHTNQPRKYLEDVTHAVLKMCSPSGQQVIEVVKEGHQLKTAPRPGVAKPEDPKPLSAPPGWKPSSVGRTSMDSKTKSCKKQLFVQ